MASVSVQISKLPPAGPITGTEAVPIVQNGQTLRTTTAAISATPSQTQTFITVNQESTLPNSRYFSTSTGLGLTDGGAQSYYRLSLNRASGSLETASTGLIVKNTGSTVVARSIAVSGNGLSISNADGVAGNPTLALDGVAASVANLGGTGILALNASGTAVAGRVITGTAGQISIVNGNGASGNPTIAIVDNVVLPGTGAVVVPVGTTAQQPSGPAGGFRYNTTTLVFEGYSNGAWRAFSSAGASITSFSAGTTGLTPFIPTVGAIVLGGTLNVDSGGTGATTLTGYVKGSGTSAFTASATIPTTDLSGTISNAQLANSSVTYNGVSVALGASGTITAVNPSALTIGTGLSGSSYNGSAPVTVAIDATVATLAGTQTFTNKSISGSTNTLTDIPNSALTNNALTIGSTVVSLGGTTATLAGLTSVTVTQDPVSALELATKQYVDAIASGLNYHQPVNYASTAALPSYVYNNGTSGVGATITASAFGALSFGGGSPSVGQRVLVKDETGANQPYNGIYNVTSAGSLLTSFVLTRSSDYDTSGAGTNEIDAGDYVLVISGSNASTAWVQQTPLPITVGTTALVFLQFNAPLTYSAGTGLNLSPATTFNMADTTVSAAAYGSASSVANFTVNAQGQLTAAASTAIAINGNQITSGTVGTAFISGSYTGITGVGTLTAGTWTATTVGVGYGGTGLATYTAGDLLYASGTTALSKLGLGASGYVLTAGTSAPQYVDPGTLSVGTATNATNTGITANSTNATNYLTFVSTTTGNLPQLVNSAITCNPSTGQITGGISGGTF